MKPLLVLLPVLILLITACQKDEVDALPKTTREGKHSFGCLIDGEAFLPKKSEWRILQPKPQEPLFAWYVKRTFDVLATGGGKRIFIRLPNVIQTGTHILADGQPATAYGSCQVGSAEYYTATTYTGQVIISRFDTVARIAAGTFEFTALDYQSGKTVTITDGRFDVRF
jgi:hypothetical protein